MTRSPSPRNGERAYALELPVGGREAVVRALDGAAHARLLAVDLAAPRERLLSAFLACVVDSLGGLAAPDADTLHDLALCDRHALVRAAMCANDEPFVDVTADCPGCERTLELTLDLAAVTLPRLPANGVVRAGDVEVRLPRPADVESVTDGAALIVRLGGESQAEAVERVLAESDPLGALEITASCPESGDQLVATCDLAGVWIDAGRRRLARLLRDVHVLARHYHWSETEILGLPASRRRAYLELCDEERADAG